MRPRHVLLGLLVVVIWGLNFIFIQVALGGIPPIFFAVLRFAFTAFPALLFVRPPRAPFRILALYGLSIFAVQFGFLFTGMKVGVPAGLASLLHQVQAFFTIALAMRVFGDRPSVWSWIGAAIAAAGIVVVALHSQGEVHIAGIGLLLIGSMGWAVGNVSAKAAGAVNPFALVVWGSLISLPPLLVVSLILEGPAAIGAAFAHLSLAVAGALAYITYVATLLGFSLWANLLRLYPSSMVAPFTLLVPVVGFVGAAVLLGEPLPGWKLGAAALVLAGLGLNLFGARVAGVLARLAAAGEP